MKTILLAWNPLKFTWGDLEDELAKFASMRLVIALGV